MPDPNTVLSNLRRPKLLVRAARIGAADYNRDRTMKRVLPGEKVPSPGCAFDVLVLREEAIEDARRTGSAAYSPARHVEVLTALLNEARLASVRMAA